VCGVGFDGPEEPEDIGSTDADALQELFDEEEVVKRLVRRERGLMSEGRVQFTDRKKADVDEVGDEEVSCAGTAKEQFCSGDAESDLEAELLRRSDTSGVDDVVTAAFNDVEGVGIGLTTVLAEVEKDLLGDAGESTERRGWDGTCNVGSTKGVVSSAG
jgi:hypothetical protein